MRRSLQLLVPVLVLALGTSVRGESDPAPASPPGVTGADDPGRYAGSYVYAGSDAERAAVEAAVDHATEGMVGMHIARAELMKRSEIRPSYALRLDGKGSMVFETPGFPTEVLPLDGAVVPFRNKYGDSLENRLRVVEGALVQESKTSDGGGSTRFELQPDGKTLRVTRISWSPKLPKTVHYRLTYLRRPASSSQ